MKILGLGTDIESVARFKPTEKKQGFFDRVFTKSEREYCESKVRPEEHYAVRFCAKEATIKALDKKIDFKEIEVLNCWVVTPGEHQGCLFMCKVDIVDKRDIFIREVLSKFFSVHYCHTLRRSGLLQLRTLLCVKETLY